MLQYRCKQNIQELLQYRYLVSGAAFSTGVRRFQFDTRGNFVFQFVPFPVGCFVSNNLAIVFVCTCVFNQIASKHFLSIRIGLQDCERCRRLFDTIAHRSWHPLLIRDLRGGYWLRSQLQSPVAVGFATPLPPLRLLSPHKTPLPLQPYKTQFQTQRTQTSRARLRGSNF